MAYLVKLSPQALRDLVGISLHIQADISAQANAWFAGLEKAIESLSTMPHRFAQLPDHPGIHQQTYGSRRNIYRILYRIDEEQRRVLVLRVRHGAREGSGI